ncbi:protein of unknown function [Burkholderia multivorans]
MGSAGKRASYQNSRGAPPWQAPGGSGQGRGTVRATRRARAKKARNPPGGPARQTWYNGS